MEKMMINSLTNVAREYEAVLVNFPNLSFAHVDRDVTHMAAKLRADFNVSPADALKCQPVFKLAQRHS
jgi:hypothetical protein